MLHFSYPLLFTFIFHKILSAIFSSQSSAVAIFSVDFLVVIAMSLTLAIDSSITWTSWSSPFSAACCFCSCVITRSVRVKFADGETWNDCNYRLHYIIFGLTFPQHQLLQSLKFIYMCHILFCHSIQYNKHENGNT